MLCAKNRTVRPNCDRLLLDTNAPPPKTVVGSAFILFIGGYVLRRVIRHEKTGADAFRPPRKHYLAGAVTVLAAGAFFTFTFFFTAFLVEALVVGAVVAACGAAANAEPTNIERPTAAIVSLFILFSSL